MEETPKKPRATRSDKGVPRGPKTRNIQRVEQPAPINVRVLLRGHIDPIEFGCAERSVENGFHVFIYPAEGDRYRYTRREFAISEVVDIEITAARHELGQVSQSHRTVEAPPEVFDLRPQGKPKPQIYSPRQARAQSAQGDVISRLESSSGPIKMTADELGGALGPGATATGVGESVA